MTQRPKRVGYRAMHYRVAAERGPAWTETCADCGEGADEWSYDHLDPDELEAEDAANLGAPYSLDVEHYAHAAEVVMPGLISKWPERGKGL